MDVKGYLYRLHDLGELIEMLTVDLQEQHAKVMKRSPQTTGDYIQTNSDPDKFANCMCEVADIRTELEKLILQYQEMWSLYTRQIRGLRNVQYIKILYSVYVKGMNLKQCAAENNMGYTTVLQKHQEALDLFEKKYAEEIMKAEEDEEQKFRKSEGTETDRWT